jgi:hypothetical protein
VNDPDQLTSITNREWARVNQLGHWYKAVTFAHVSATGGPFQLKGIGAGSNGFSIAPKLFRSHLCAKGFIYDQQTIAL